MKTRTHHAIVDNVTPEYAVLMVYDRKGEVTDMMPLSTDEQRRYDYAPQRGDVLKLQISFGEICDIGETPGLEKISQDPLTDDEVTFEINQFVEAD